MIKNSNPNIGIDEPAPGHVVVNYNPKRVFIEDEGHLVPPGSVHIAPEFPTELLQAIIDARSAGDPVEVEDTKPQKISEVLDWVNNQENCQEAAAKALEDERAGAGRKSLIKKLKEIANMGGDQ